MPEGMKAGLLMPKGRAAGVVLGVVKFVKLTKLANFVLFSWPRHVVSGRAVTGEVRLSLDSGDVFSSLIPIAFKPMLTIIRMWPTR